MDDDVSSHAIANTVSGPGSSRENRGGSSSWAVSESASWDIGFIAVICGRNFLGSERVLLPGGGRGTATTEFELDKGLDSE
jgi:hypothetical protein